MALQFSPYSAVGLTAGTLALVLATLILVARPDRSQNRRLALALTFEGLAIGIMYGVFPLLDGPGGIHVIGTIFAFSVWMLGFQYLLFIGTLPTPLGRPFRGPVMVAITILAAGLVVAALVQRPTLVLHGFYEDAGVLGWGPLPGALVAIGVFLMPLVSLYGLICAVHVLLRYRTIESPEGRRRARLVATSFGIRDLGHVLLFVGVPAWGVLSESSAGVSPAWNAVAEFSLFYGLPVVMLIYLPIVAYSILRGQVFDIDLRIKTGMSRTLVIGFIIGGAVLVAELLENLVASRAGALGGIGVALGLAAVARPMKRVSDRVMDKIMPGVRPEEPYLQRRRYEVYEDTARLMLEDGELSSKDQRVLAGLQQRMGMSDGEAERLLRPLRLKPEKPPGTA